LKIVLERAMPRPVSTSVISELALSHSTAMRGFARMGAKMLVERVANVGRELAKRYGT